MLPELFTIPFTDWGIKSYGFMLMVGFLSAAWFAMRRAVRVKQDPDFVLNIAFVSLFSGVAGARIFYVLHYWDEQFATAANRLVAVINISAGGLEYFGGLVGGMVGVGFYVIVWSRLQVRRKPESASPRSFRLYTDIVMPSILWGLAITRIGCFLNGCCWGGLCVDPQTGAKSMAWAVSFPFGSPAMIRQWENRQLPLPAELIRTFPAGITPYPLGRDSVTKSDDKRKALADEVRQARSRLETAKQTDPESESTQSLSNQVKAAESRYAAHFKTLGGLPLATQNASRVDETAKMSADEIQQLSRSYRSLPVHPAQLYGLINGVLLAGLMSAVFYRRKRHGMLLGLMMVLYPISRFILELIRIDNPKDQVGGMTISQAVSIGMVVAGSLYLIALYAWLPLRSPRAVEFVLPSDRNT